MASPSGRLTVDEYIEAFQRALVERPDYDHRDDVLSALCTMLTRRAEKTGSMDDLNAAIKAGEEAATLTIEGDPRRGDRFNDLSRSLRLRASLTKSVEDATAAINHAKTALAAVPRAAGTNAALFVDNFSITMRLRSKLTGTLEDLNVIIYSLQKTLKWMPEEDTEGRAILFNSLGNSIADRIGLSLPEAVEDTEYDLLMQARVTAAELTPSSNSNFLGVQNNLASAYLERFRRTKMSTDLENAIEKMQEIVKLIPPGDPLKVKYLHNLATCLQDRQKLLDCPADRNAILQALDDKLNLAKGWDRNDVGTRIDRASQLAESFEFTGSTDDLNTAVEEFQQISDLLPQDDERQSGFLNNFGLALFRRGERLKSADDIQAAILAFRGTLKFRVTDLHERGNAFTHIGMGWMTGYSWTGLFFEQAFSAYEEALRLMPNDSAKQGPLANLGILFHTRFDKTGNLDDLRKVIEYNREVVRIARSKANMNQVLGFVGLANAYRDLYKRTGSEDDLNSAIEAYEEGLECLQSSPSKRITSGARGAYLAAITNPRKATALFKKAIELLPTASPRTLNRDDQQHTLSSFSGISADAAMVSIQAGEGVEEALRLLELGRGVMMSTELETRSDITDLNAIYPHLATQFKKLREKLDLSGPVALDEAGHAAAPRPASRHATSQEFDEMIKTIRNQTGFENFLLGPCTTDLTKLAVEGPIVYLNTSHFGSGSFLITTTGVNYLPLPQLTIADASRNANMLAKTLYHDNIITRRESIRVMRKILKWLWDVAIEHILLQLGFTEKPQNDSAWPHVWWIPIGCLSIFPFHAAGHYPADGRNTLDRVISSYTPTTRALGYARDRAKQSKRGGYGQQVLMVVMPETTSMSPLPFCAKEADTINTLLPQSIPREILFKPTGAELLEKIKQCSVVHFSCHGGVASNPSKSQIYLQDWQTNPLTVGDIAALKLDYPRLAYLSACHAASSIDYRLMDEAIHMAGACQLAGFPSVVGTLWHVSDSQTAILTEDFYGLLLDKDDKLEFRNAARALHFAARKIRDDTSQRADDPVVWAPYIHVGM